KLDAVYRDALAVEPKKRTPEQKKLAEHAEILLKITWDELLEVLPPAERVRRAAWRMDMHALEAKRPSPPAHPWAIQHEEKIPPTHVLHRGDPKRKGAVVRPAFLRALAVPGARSADRGAPSTDRQALDSSPALTRLDLARWLTSPDHPLTARVMVNHLWQHHF